MSVPAPDAIEVSLLCARCGARLVPVPGAWAPRRARGTSAFLCPRFDACGRGGRVERALPA